MGGEKLVIVARAGSWLACATITELGFSTETEALRVNYEGYAAGKAVALLGDILRPPVVEVSLVIIPMELYELAQKWDEVKCIHSPGNRLHTLIGRYSEIQWLVFNSVKDTLHALRHNSLYIEPKSERRLRMPTNVNQEEKEIPQKRLETL